MSVRVRPAPGAGRWSPAGDEVRVAPGRVAGQGWRVDGAATTAATTTAAAAAGAETGGDREARAEVVDRVLSSGDFVPGGKVTKALAPVFHRPAWQPAKLDVPAWSRPCVSSQVVVMGIPLSSRLDCMLILVTGWSHSTVESDVVQTLPLFSKVLASPAKITQLMVWSPQLAGLMAAPGLTAQGWMS